MEDERDAKPADSASAVVRQLAASHPSLAALEVGGDVVTYAELDVAADRLAQRLLADFGPGHHRVALQFETVQPMLVASLALSRAGLVSVPIDPTAPPERVSTILREVDPVVLLTDSAGPAVGDVPVAHPLHYGADPPDGGIDLPSGPVSAIMFTSGSTGTPKGIVMPHVRGASWGMFDAIRNMDNGWRVGVLVSGTVGWNAGMMLGMLVTRATIVAYDVRRAGTTSIAEWLDTSRVFAIITVPTLLREVLAPLPPDRVISSLGILALYGETSTWEDIALIRRHVPDNAMIYNLFGLTETGFISGLLVTKDTPLGTGPLPLGAPFSDLDISIVGEDGRPVPDGEPGEIVVTKRHAALGYWAQPDLTRAVFESSGDGLTRVRTGDGGRRRPDGELEHLGRLDHLVKIAGNRVELGEIETALRSIDGVSDGAVTTYTDSASDTRLTAFVVTDTGATVNPVALRAALARRLPGSMLPDSIDILPSLPKLANGKVDRRSLPAREPRRSGADLTAPQGASRLERELIGLWRSVLDLDDVGLHDNFFELGGDSIRAARLFTKVKTRLGIDRPISVLLEAPTIAELAAVLEGDASPWHSLVPIQPEGYRTPLFVVHEASGDVFYARALAEHLGLEQPVYGLRGVALEGIPVEESSVEELAARYVAEVRRFRPDGPYAFYGWSAGGVIAFEMARQIEATGGVVTLVGLGDAAGPGTFPDLSSGPVESLRSRIAGRVAEVRARSGRAALHHAVGVVRDSVVTRARARIYNRRRLESEISVAVSRGEPVPQEARGRFALDQYGPMSFCYRPDGKVRGQVLLVRAEAAGVPADRGWSDFVEGELAVADVDALHLQMGKEPAAGQIAAALQRALTAAASVEL